MATHEETIRNLNEYIAMLDRQVDYDLAQMAKARKALEPSYWPIVLSVGCLLVGGGLQIAARVLA